MSNKIKEIIELCQKQLADSINAGAVEVRKDRIDISDMIGVMYINQLRIMIALDIILEDMKE